MTTTQVPPTSTDGGHHRQPDPEPARRRTRGDVLRLLSRGFGQTILTIGLVIGLYIVYAVWVTNIKADQEQAQVHQQFQQELDNPTIGSSTLQLPGSKQSTIPAGTGIANIYIPRLGQDYVYTIVEYHSDADLEKGPAHYWWTQLPGQEGNFGISGHRVGKGEPFLNLDQLRPGDPVVIQVPGYWYVYHILGQGNDLSAKDANGVPGQEIVDPSAVQVLAPVPDQLGSKPNGHYITMTTCTPKYSASQRLVLHGSLVETKVAQGKELPSELGGSL